MSHDIDIKTMLASADALSAADRGRVADRIYQLERELTTVQHASFTLSHIGATLPALIADDSHAMSFQSTGQYRTALLEAAGQRKPAQAARPNIKTWQDRMPAPRVEMRCSMNCYPKHHACDDCEPVTIHGDPVKARDEEIAELRALRAPVQAQGTEKADVLSETETLQFLTDVVTAAGLLSHGKTDKGLARRVSECAYKMRDALLAQAQPASADDARDAARYRWLRDQSTSDDQIGSFSPYAVMGQLMTVLDGAKLDRAIDAAIAALTGSGV